MIVVKKYGGSSVSDTIKIVNIAKYLIEEAKDNKIVVVVSAMGKTTDNLIKLSNSITDNPNKREMDRLLSTGEQQTIALLSIAINSLGHKSVSLTGEQAKIKTKGIHTKNEIINIDNTRIKNYLDKGYIVVVAGFQGINENEDITTLGRGGSDTTAVALAASLNAQCNIYTDVDGVYTVDPRIYEKAKKIERISYEEMMELSYKGAKIMETRSIELANKYNVDLTVGLSLSKNSGTLITNKENILEQKKITGLSVNNNLLHVTIDNIATYAKNLLPIFEILNQLKITIDMISQNDVLSNEGSFAFTVNKNDYNLLQDFSKKVIQKFRDVKISIKENRSKITLVGIGMMSNSEIITKVFKILNDNDFSFHQISTSEISISILVDVENEKEIVQLLANEFNL